MRGTARIAQCSEFVKFTMPWNLVFMIEKEVKASLETWPFNRAADRALKSFQEN